MKKVAEKKEDTKKPPAKAAAAMKVIKVVASPMKKVKEVAVAKLGMKIATTAEKEPKKAVAAVAMKLTKVVVAMKVATPKKETKPVKGKPAVVKVLKPAMKVTPPPP